MDKKENVFLAIILYIKLELIIHRGVVAHLHMCVTMCTGYIHCVCFKSVTINFYWPPRHSHTPNNAHDSQHNAYTNRHLDCAMFFAVWMHVEDL